MVLVVYLRRAITVRVCLRTRRAAVGGVLEQSRALALVLNWRRQKPLFD